MKIAIIGAKNYDSLEYHIHHELISRGDDAKIFDYTSKLPAKVTYGLGLLSPKYDILKNKNLLGKVLDFKPDLVIGIYRNIHPIFVKQIKTNKIKIIHINPDQLTTLNSQQIFAEPYDAYFTKDPYILSFMKDKMHLNAFQYQEAFSPRIHTKSTKDQAILEKEIGIDVLAFGTLYPYRGRMLQILKEKGSKITTYGRLAKYFEPSMVSDFNKKFITGEEKSTLLRGAKIVFNNLHYAEVESVNNKFFEINGSGAFQICDYKPILHELLPIDPNKVSFNSIDEADKLIKKYLNEPEERWEIRDVIYDHFMNHYTYSHMLNSIFKAI